MSIRVSILTLSDSVANGKYEDRSGPAVLQRCMEMKWETVKCAVLPDDRAAIKNFLKETADSDPVDFNSHHWRHRLGSIEGEDAVYQTVRWPEGEFEIDFNGSASRNIISRSTTGLLMEALRLMDEGQRDSEDAPATENAPAES